jgi:hypothetical protein
MPLADFLPILSGNEECVTNLSFHRLAHTWLQNITGFLGKISLLKKKFARRRGKSCPVYETGFIL